MFSPSIALLQILSAFCTTFLKPTLILSVVEVSLSGPISEVSPLSGYRLRLTHRLSRQHGTWSTIGKFNRNIREIVTVRTKSLFSIIILQKKLN